MTNPGIRSVELLLAPMAQNWLTERVIANPLSIYPEYAERRSSWYRTMSAGVVRIETDDGVVGLGFVGAARPRPRPRCSTSRCATCSSARTAWRPS